MTRVDQPRSEIQSRNVRAGHPASEPHGASARAGHSTYEFQDSTARAGQFRHLLMLERAWQDAQKQRKSDGNRLKAIRAYGGDSPALAALVEMEKKAEDALSREMQKAMREHPLHAWQKNVKGLGEHNCAVILALLDGDPYIAYPKLWVKGSGATRTDGHEKKREIVALEPRVRSVSQLWSYCGLNPERPPKREGMTQEELLARGNAYLGARVRIAVEGLLKVMCDACHRDVAGRASYEGGKKTYGGWAPPPLDCSCEHDGFAYRAFFDRMRLHYQDATHSRPCRGRGTCGLDVGTPWRDGHKRQAALNVVAKQLLVDMYDEAKRLHLSGEWK